MARYWCFTLNNPKQLIDFEEFKNLTYGIYSEEVGEHGTYHFQGYLEFNRTTRLGAVRKLLPGVHAEPRKGTQQEAMDYCKKLDATHLGGPYEWGTPSKGQGGRTDLKELQNDLSTGMSLQGISDKYFGQFIRYHRGISLYSSLHMSQEDRKPLVSYYYGPTGTGKTATATLAYPEAYWKDSQSKWWDGYSGEECVLIDDFRGGITFASMLRWLDRYRKTGETKGGHVPLKYRRVIITSNKMAHSVYHSEGLDIAAFLRRIDSFLHFRSGGEILKFTDYSKFLEEVQ